MVERYSSHFIGAPDGLKLHVRSYGADTGGARTVVCLPGLARTSADFDPLAVALSSGAAGPRRRVVALDYRGRGRSEYDRKPENYNPAVELADVIAVMTALGAAPAVVVGTSRGGILAMLLAVARPAMIAGAVLNDIGPAIEPKGLMRIKGYVGKFPQFGTFEEGAEILHRIFSAQFPNLTAAQWLDFARRSFEEKQGRLVPNYDLRLTQSLADIDPERPLPTMWKEFDALAAFPLMAIRGGHSDILSAETFAAMKARQPAIQDVEIADEGHAPMLADQQTIARIADFVSRCD